MFSCVICSHGVPDVILGYNRLAGPTTLPFPLKKGFQFVSGGGWQPTYYCFSLSSARSSLLFSFLLSLRCLSPSTTSSLYTRFFPTHCASCLTHLGAPSLQQGLRMTRSQPVHLCFPSLFPEVILSVLLLSQYIHPAHFSKLALSTCLATGQRGVVAHQNLYIYSLLLIGNPNSVLCSPGTLTTFDSVFVFRE